jgi:hypothetical protein
MNLEKWLKLQGISIQQAADTLGVKEHTLTHYIRQWQIPSPAMVARVWEMTGGLVTAADFKQPNTNQRELQAPVGEIPAEKNLVLLMRQSFGRRLTETCNGYVLDGRPIATVELYRKLDRFMRAAGTPIKINYPGV